MAQNAQMPSTSAIPASMTQKNQAAKDATDARIAQRRLRELKAGKTRAIPAEEVYKKLGI